jgi:hypothetical protein
MKSNLFAAVLAAFFALSIAVSSQVAVAGCPSYDPNCQQPRP